MPKKALRRILKKKAQIKKKIKKQIKKENTKNQQQNPQQKNQQQMTPLNRLGFFPQQYGNPDLAMQQMRNQNQSYNDQIYSATRTIESMKKENTELKNKLETIQKDTKKMNKKSKELTRDFKNAETEKEIAEDKLKDSENLQRKRDYYKEKLHNIDMQQIEEAAQPDIQKLQKQQIEWTEKLHEQQLERKHQEMEIEKNKAAAKLKEIIDETNLVMAQVKGANEYMNSPQYKKAEEVIVDAIAKRMQANDAKKFLDEHAKLANQIEENHKYLKEHPDDHKVIQTQLGFMIDAQQNKLASQNKLLNEYKDKEYATEHLRQQNRELHNKTIDNFIELQGYSNKFELNENEQKELTDEAVELTKQLNQMKLQNETMKEQIELKKKLNDEKKKNKLLDAEKEAYKDAPNNPQYQQQVKDLVKQETELKMQQEIGNELDLTIKKAKQNQAAAFANDTKANVAGTIYNCDDNSGYGNDFSTVQQVNAGLDAIIDNEHELSEHIDNVQECDRLRRQIYDYKYNRDTNGDKWLSLYQQTFPILQNGTNLTNIDDPRIIAQIADQYAEKNNGGYKSDSIADENNSGNFNKVNFEEEEEES